VPHALDARPALLPGGDVPGATICEQ
jgi:hypothetical protein